MLIHLRRHDKLRGQGVSGQQAYGEKSQGALYGQKASTPHLVRISLIVSWMRAQ